MADLANSPQLSSPLFMVYPDHAQAGRRPRARPSSFGSASATTRHGRQRIGPSLASGGASGDGACRPRG